MTHLPRKRFGQNFLHDHRVLHAIAAAVGARATDHLVEIGPGQGALTEYLLAECGQLDVVELDRDLVEFLRRKFAGRTKLSIHSGDALKFDFARLAEAAKIRVVGNLPYNISTPLLFHLFEQAFCIEDMHFMLQKEVVDRLCAEPGTKTYGRLSVMAQYYCDMESLMDVFPESFSPPPKVVSSVVRLVPHGSRPTEASTGALQRVVAAAFGQRRKTLRNALSGLLTEQDLREAGIDSGARAEMLALADYTRLAGLLMERGSK